MMHRLKNHIRHCEEGASPARQSTRSKIARKVLTLSALAILIAFASPHAMAQDITTGLVAHWKLDETSGATAMDSAGSNNGTMSGGINGSTDSVPGRVGKALSFDGADDFIDVTPQLTSLMGTGWSISLWFYTTAAPAGGQTLYSEGSNSALNWFSVDIRGGDNVLELSLNGNPAGSNSALGTTVIQDNQWYHGVIVKDASDNCYVYINGKLDAGPGDCVRDPLGIDRAGIGILRRDSNGEPFNGVIDELRIYNRVLTAEDVAELAVTVPGHLRYNTNHRTAEYHDGTGWVATGPQKYIPNAVAFDGNTHLVAGGSVRSDTKQFTLSIWFQKNAEDQRSIYESSNTEHLISNSDEDITFKVDGETLANALHFDLPANTVTVKQWHHLLISADVTGADPGNVLVYVDGVAVSPNVTSILDDTLNFNNGVNLDIGEDVTGTWIGSMADFWFDGVFINIADPNERAKFISDTGEPVWLGENGSLPTGAAPDIYLSGDTATWHTNKGTGGGFTENGALTDSAKPVLDPIGDPPTTGLVARWRLDESGAATVADDAVGTADLTLTNFATPASSWTVGRLGNGLSFVSANSEYMIRNSHTYSPPYTYTLWFMVDSNPTSTMTLIQAGWENSCGTQPNLEIGADESLSVNTGGCGGAGNRENTVPGVVKVGKWHFLALIATSKGWELYLDGKFLHANSDNPSLSNGNCVQFGVGNLTCGNPDGTFFDGYMDDIRRYSRALSQSEIAMLYSGACANPERAAGSIIYNTTRDVMQFCDGEDWIAMGPVPGAGGAGCANPAGAKGEMVFNTTRKVMQYCDGTSWIAVGKPPRLQCSASPGAGEEGCAMPDGAIYAGLSPDGNIPMYTTTEDEGGFPWNNGNSSGVVDTSIASCTGAEASCRTGEANTTTLISTDADSSVGGTQPHQAAQTCANLNVHGHDDWYLPSYDELNVLYQNKSAITGFNETGTYPSGWYWSSSEGTSGCAQIFSVGTRACIYNKTGPRSVRCVRR